MNQRGEQTMIAVKKDTHKQLSIIKAQIGAKTFDELMWMLMGKVRE